MSVSPFTTRRAALVAATLTATLALAGCGASATSPTAAAPSGASSTTGAPVGPAAKGPHNSADIAFATDMIPHHTQAVMMADMALGTSKNAQILTLAREIKGGQDPEINTMKGWLRGWAAPAAGGGHDMSSMPSGSMTSAAPHASSMTGMMSDQQMQGLAGATGVAFDRLWITMMTEHHTGAIAMARTELATGQNPEAKTLAEQIITAQTTELTTMAALTKTLA